jgi:regulator of replication initiation timing
MKGLQGSLEDRAKLAATLQEENTKLQETLTQLRERLQREEDDNRTSYVKQKYVVEVGIEGHHEDVYPV